MNAWIRSLLVAGVLGVASLATTQTAEANDYWDGYWGWYDNTYSPYYHRQYSYYPYGGYYGSGYYGGGYGYPYGGNYGSRYGGWGGNYYGTPGIGYYDRWGGGGGVNIGGLQFGWR